MAAENREIYLDNHATTPVDPRVLEAMLPYFGERFGNPSSRTHWHGHEASAAVDRAREAVAAALGAEPREVLFTSGATESNRLAILVAARGARGSLTATAIEHKSILESGLASVVKVPVAASGIVDPGAVGRAIGPGTGLVAVMAANNEIGTIQPVAEVARLCAAAGVPLLCDATAAAGRIPLDVRDLGADFVSLSAHKFYGPKGVGALVVRASSRPPPSRPGTANVPGIVGLAAALALAMADMDRERRRLAALRARLLDRLRSDLDGMTINGDPERRLEGNLSVAFAGVDGPSLGLALEGLAVSSGAACASGAAEPSHVLLAIGRPRSAALASIRFGLGRFNDEDDVDRAAAIVVAAVRRLRGSSSPVRGKM